jgi:hypothetical protein
LKIILVDPKTNTPQIVIEQHKEFRASSSTINHVCAIVQSSIMLAVKSCTDKNFDGVFFGLDSRQKSHNADCQNRRIARITYSKAFLSKKTTFRLVLMMPWQD